MPYRVPTMFRDLTPCRLWHQVGPGTLIAIAGAAWIRLHWNGSVSLYDEHTASRKLISLPFRPTFRKFRVVGTSISAS